MNHLPAAALHAAPPSGAASLHPPGERASDWMWPNQETVQVGDDLQRVSFNYKDQCLHNNPLKTLSLKKQEHYSKQFPNG